MLWDYFIFSQDQVYNDVCCYKAIKEVHPRDHTDPTNIQITSVVSVTSVWFVTPIKLFAYMTGSQIKECANLDFSYIFSFY